MKNSKSCVVCLQVSSYPLCGVCRTSPLLIEKGRQKLAESKDLKSLQKLYQKSFSEIKNLNTGVFWDKKLYKVEFLKDQDGMTKERIQISASYILKNSTKILDIGAGYGFLEEVLSKKKDLEVNANDISKVAIENLKTRFNGRFKVESIFNLNYRKNYFDVVFALEVLEHIPPTGTFKALSNIREVLKKNGFLVISVPTNEGLEQKSDNPSGHVRDYTVPLITTELKLAGFRILNIKILYAFKNFYLLKKIISKLVIDKWKPNDIIIKAQKPL